ncbi:MAG: hypothetical protein GWP44_08855 [Proteobacteria bacterium]|nr:hypothetical protein [Pseudomonadota bacterium]
MRSVALLALAASLASAAPLQAQTLSPIEEGTSWTLAAVGDAIMNRRLSPFDHPGDPAFHDMANIIRAADAAFMNLEQSIFRL